MPDPVEERMRQWQDELRRHREYMDEKRQASAPPLGRFVTKAWLRSLEQAVRNGRAAEAIHMLGIELSKPPRMPTLAEHP